MDTQKKLILKVIYGETKFNHLVLFTDQQPITFLDLKAQIYEKLQKLNAITTEQLQSIQVSDANNFQYFDSDMIDSLIKNDDIINVKFALLQQKETTESQIEQAQQVQSEPSDPKEAICVLYDISGSMQTSFFDDQELSRIGAVNSWFSAFADKTMGFEFNHIVQLICFSDQILVRCEFNNDFEKFIKLVDEVDASGSTKLYDAIAQAIENLLKIKQKYPKIILRIIALTDGEDNSSTNTPQNLVKSIIENKIVIDSFAVSKNCNSLKTLTHASGGRCYCPRELSQGMQLFEIETILSVEARDIGAEGLNPNIDLNTLEDRPFDTEGIKQSQKQLKQQAEKPEVIIKKMEQEEKELAEAGKKSTQTCATKRVLKELNEYINKPLPNVKIFPTKDNILQWKALLIGPKDTSYNSGAFLISIEFPSDYPFKPPKIKFLTQIYHCNFSQQGSFCQDILHDQWSPLSTITKVLESLLNLLQNPNIDNAVDSTIAALMMHEKEKFKEKVKEETLKFANQDAAALVQDILGGDLNQMNADELENLKQELDAWIKQNRI